MRLKSVMAVLLAAALCICSACASDGAGETSSESGTAAQTSSAVSGTDGSLSLSYSGTDTFDPYTAVTKYNKELCQLLYDTLVVLDSNFNPVYRLADSITLNGKTCTVVIKDAVFSDGTSVTASDVVYSLKKAQKSSTKFAAQLSGVASCTASGSRTLVITLSSVDPYFVNLLDFPILKQGSDDRTNDDGKALPPTGSGRYVYDESSETLTANPNYLGGSLALGTIKLINTPDDESLEHNIEVGNISVSYSDLSDNTPIKMTGKSLSIGLNNLVYLGINFGNAYLSNPQFRQAVSLALGRQKIVDSAYTGYATPAKGPLPSGWTEASGLQTMSSTADSLRAAAILKEIGYTNKDQEGYFLDAAGKRISLTLLCNLDNTARVAAAELIRSQLKEIGVEVNVRTVNWDAYSAELNAGSFDLYIGEVMLQNNMNLTSLLTPGSGACFGYIKTETADSSTSSVNSTSSTATGTSSTGSADTSYLTVSAYDAAESLYAGTGTMADVIAAFNAELPVIPICHRQGQVAYSSAIASGLNSTLDDLFYGIENISFQ